MRFQVPQFIEVEDKIFGPFTFKQFVYLAGGAGMIAIAFTFLPKFLAFLVALPIAGLAAALTFYKVNNRPFIYTLEAYLNYLLTKKLFVWKTRQRTAQAHPSADTNSERPQVQVPKISGSRLRDLTWDLSVKGRTDINQTKDTDTV